MPITLYLIVVFVNGEHYATIQTKPQDSKIEGFVFEVSATDERGDRHDSLLVEVQDLAKKEARKRQIPYVINLDVE